jgi:bacillithiol biosynthesis deacetylase BshB1
MAIQKEVMDTDLDILAFSPHPDDAEMGSAGSLIKAVQNGLRAGVIDLTEGSLASRGNLKQRQKEKQKATDLMGLCLRQSLGLPDSEIGKKPEHRLSIINMIRETRPRIVLAPYWKDRHPDHAAAGKLIQEAVFYSGVAKLGSGQPYKPDRLYYYMIHHPFQPSFVVDISEEWDQKMAVLRVYQSQFQFKDDEMETAISQPEFMQFVKARAVWFGAMIGANYGEPFLVKGPVPLSELPGSHPTFQYNSHLPPYCMFT